MYVAIKLIFCVKCIVGYNIVLPHMLKNMKYRAYDFVLPSVSVVEGEAVGDEEELG